MAPLESCVRYVLHRFARLQNFRLDDLDPSNQGLKWGLVRSVRTAMSLLTLLTVPAMDATSDADIPWKLFCQKRTGRAGRRVVR